MSAFARKLRQASGALRSVPLFLSTSTFLLFAISLISFVTGIFFSGDMSKTTVSLSFVSLAIVLPVLSMVAAFCIQIVSIYITFEQQRRTASATSTILSCIEMAQLSSAVSRIMMTHLIDSMRGAFFRLGLGTMSLDRDYWDINHHFYALASAKVENTSLVPLTYWDQGDSGGNTTLISYNDKQKSLLVDRGIIVTRTFLLRHEDLLDPRTKERLIRIITRQLQDGFALFFINVDEWPEETKSEIYVDLTIVDDIIISMARISQDNESVMTYDYYDLSVIRKHPQEYEHVWRLFANNIAFARGEPPILKYWDPEIRRKINELPFLREKEYSPHKTVIEEMMTRVSYPSDYDFSKL